MKKIIEYLKKIIEYFKNEPAALYHLITVVVALVVPVIVSVIVFALRGGA